MFLVMAKMLSLFPFIKTGLPSVAPPTVRPLPRPDVTPPTNADITLLYAQGQKIGALPLNGTRLNAAQAKTLLTLHVRDGKIDTAYILFFIFILLKFLDDVCKFK